MLKRLSKKCWKILKVIKKFFVHKKMKGMQIYAVLLLSASKLRDVICNRDVFNDFRH